ncbi:MAG TPA: YceD family protein [Actinomycetota bacterium]|nr:YceD family protein [Actinomycetota bacterium]
MRPVDVRDLLARPGSARPLLVAEPVEGMRTELAGVPDDRPVRVELRLESVVEGIWATGELGGRMVLRCARCLVEFERPFAEPVEALFTPAPDPEADEYPLSEEGEIDLEPLVRDAVVLSMPFSPLCRPDCLGLCPRCGGDRNLGGCTCPPEAADPRWEPLRGLFDTSS